MITETLNLESYNDDPTQEYRVTDASLKSLEICEYPI